MITTSAAHNKVALRAPTHRICDILTYSEEDTANARLIATAPCLLEALKMTAASAGYQYMMAETREIIEAAIAKAEGRT